MSAGYQFIDHTADYAMRVWAPDFAELLDQALHGLIRLMADVEGLAPSESRIFAVSGDSPEQVLVRTLKELLLLEDDGLLAVDARVLEVRPSEARFEVDCVALHTARHHLEAAVKAVTYHDLHIRTVPEGLVVEMVLDT